MKATVAIVQTAPVFLDKTATIDKACRLIREAAEAGSGLIVFPEAFVAGYPDWVWVVPNNRKPLLASLYQRLLANAVTVPDEATKQLAETAAEAGINVVIGVNERNAEASGSSLFNTILFIG
ncbi:MAG: carbon-nitrogen hydrolase family protein, partial [Candidatus Zixiibacteriota bacterium]